MHLGATVSRQYVLKSETYRDTESGLCSTGAALYELHLYALLSPSLVHLLRQLQCTCQIHAQL